jgi:hypothetical protein
MDPTTNPAADPILDLIPPGYRGLALACIILTPILGRAWQALKLNGGLKGVWNALIFGTNTPKILIACLALLSLTSCGLTSQQWAAIGKGVLIREAPIVYGEVQAVKSAKNPVAAVTP